MNVLSLPPSIAIALPFALPSRRTLRRRPSRSRRRPTVHCADAAVAHSDRAAAIAVSHRDAVPPTPIAAAAAAAVHRSRRCPSRRRRSSRAAAHPPLSNRAPAVHRNRAAAVHCDRRCRPSRAASHCAASSLALASALAWRWR